MSDFKNNSKAKRYFWLKLKTDFFEQKEIKLLRRIAGGDTYTIIYLKMLLRSLKNEGKLFYEFYGDNFSEEIALDIDENTEDVAMTIKYLESKGLIELVEQDEYFLSKVPEMIGSESYSTERVRRFRERKALQGNTQALQSNSEETSCNEEIDIEKEIDIELEIDNKNTLSNQNLKERFDSVWKLYPNKKGKDKAYKAYCKAIKEKVSDETIINGIERYKKEIALKKTEQQYIAHGSTWFNQKRWEDDFQVDPMETNGSSLNEFPDIGF